MIRGQATSYQAVLLGSTGAVGSSLLNRLINNPKCTGVTVFVRRPLDNANEKVKQFVVDFDNFEKNVDEFGGPEKLLEGHTLAFNCMGVGQPSVTPVEVIEKVEIDYLQSFVNVCKKSNAVEHMALLTSVGSDANSWFSLLARKGRAEKMIENANFSMGATAVRPSLMLTDEPRYGVPQKLVSAVFPKISWMMPSNAHEVHVKDVALSMLLNSERKLFTRHLKMDAPFAFQALEWPQMMEELASPDTTVSLPKAAHTL